MSNENNAPGFRAEEAAPVALPANVGPTLIGMLGTTERGPTTPQVITKWSDFVRIFGGFTTNVDLAVHVRQAMDNGAAGMVLQRVVAADAVAASGAADFLRRGGTASTLTVTAANPGEWGNDLALNFVRAEVLSTGSSQPEDGDGNELPNHTDNASGRNAFFLPVTSVTEIGVGDVVDIFTSAGVYADTAICVGIDAANRGLILEQGTGVDVAGAGSYVRTASQHRAKTYAAEGLATGQTNLLLGSVAGISKGSLLTAFIYSHCKTNVEASVLQVSKLVVERISGNRVYFDAAVTEHAGSDIPATTNASLRYTADAGIYVDFAAKDEGPVGNRVAVAITTGADALAVSVNGKTITIACAADTDLAALKAAVEAHAAANALVTVTVTGDDETVVSDALVSTRLTGGAQLQVISQEFGFDVYLGESKAASHNFLSMVSTSPDYIETRLGGDPTTSTPVSGSESALIIVSGVDGAPSSGSNALLGQPRALSSVGLSGGDDGSDLTDADWIGAESPLSGAQLLASYEGMKIACAPGITSVDCQTAFVDLAVASGKFVWLLDPPSDVASAQDLLDHRVTEIALNTSFAQLCSSWGYVQDMRGARRGVEIEVPGTPAWAGLIAQAQRDGGAHASAGGLVPNWNRAKFVPTPTDAGVLNANGICCWRITGNRLRMYGDRTLLQIDTDPRVFGSTRRSLNQMMHDMEAAMVNGKIIFAANNTSLYPRVENIAKGVLEQMAKRGALYTPDDRSYFVKCNTETTTPEDVGAGKVYFEVGVTPAGLAEMIVMRLQVSAAGLQVVSNT